MEFVFTIGMSALIGVALGFRFSVFVLIPTIILAGVSTAVIEASRGEPWSIVLTVVLVVTTLQISYLAGSIMRAAFEKRVPLEGNTDSARHIQENMEVVGSDGEHVGTIDHIESADGIVLTGDDPKAGGKPRLISVAWVDYVDSKVHLNRPSRKVVSEWRVAA
jgi:hypothetical protein